MVSLAIRIKVEVRELTEKLNICRVMCHASDNKLVWRGDNGKATFFKNGFPTGSFWEADVFTLVEWRINLHHSRIQVTYFVNWGFWHILTSHVVYCEGTTQQHAKLLQILLWCDNVFATTDSYGWLGVFLNFDADWDGCKRRLSSHGKDTNCAHAWCWCKTFIDVHYILQDGLKLLWFTGTTDLQSSKVDHFWLESLRQRSININTFSASNQTIKNLRSMAE